MKSEIVQKVEKSETETTKLFHSTMVAMNKVDSYFVVVFCTKQKKNFYIFLLDSQFLPILQFQFSNNSINFWMLFCSCD